ncbi:MAG: CobD/CbiB family protein [Burkholderiales bacterium]|nr:CobD/CbiB family protein [Burkholderiales bacterium]
MNLIAILAALGLEQWRAFEWRGAVERAFVRYVRALERKLNGGTRQHGVIAAVAAILPPVLAVEVVYWFAAAAHPLAGLVVNVVVLYFLMGFRRFSHAISAIVAALQAGDLSGARRTLAMWRGGSTSDLGSADIARVAIERGLVDAYRSVFGVLFWFVVLPGPIGAVLYRAAVLLAEEWRGPVPGVEPTPLVQARALFGAPARTLLAVLDWLPVRVTALSFAVVGDFEDAVVCWRTQSARWVTQEGGRTVGILLATGGGALGVQLGGMLPTLSGDPDVRPELGVGDPVEPEVLPSAVGLVWRALVVWLLLILLLILANLAP